MLIKLCEGGWILAREIFNLQKVFTEEKAFFQALCFIKRIEVSQFEVKNKINQVESGGKESVGSKTDDVLIKLNENMGKPGLNLHLKKDDNEQLLRQMIKDSIFNEYICKFEVVDSNHYAQMIEKVGDAQIKNQRKCIKIMTDHSAVVSGLKCML